MSLLWFLWWKSVVMSHVPVGLSRHIYFPKVKMYWSYFRKYIKALWLILERYCIFLYPTRNWSQNNQAIYIYTYTYTYTVWLYENNTRIYHSNFLICFVLFTYSFLFFFILCFWKKNNKKFENTDRSSYCAERGKKQEKERTQPKMSD